MRDHPPAEQAERAQGPAAPPDRCCVFLSGKPRLSEPFTCTVFGAARSMHTPHMLRNRISNGHSFAGRASRPCHPARLKIGEVVYALPSRSLYRQKKLDRMETQSLKQPLGRG